MVGKPILQHYREEILRDVLKLKGISESYENADKDRKEKMSHFVRLRRPAQPHALGDLCKSSRDSVLVEDPSEDVEKFRPLFRENGDYVAPRLCRMEDVDFLMDKERKYFNRSEKRDDIPVQTISRLCKCLMPSTSRAEKTPRGREIKSTTTSIEGCCRRSLRKERREVERVNLFCHGGRYENAEVDRRRAAEEHERIQHQREKLIDPRPLLQRSKISEADSRQESGCIVAKHLKNVCDIIHHKQIQAPGLRSMCLASLDKKEKAPTSKFSRSCALLMSGLRETRYKDCPKSNEKHGRKVERDVRPITRICEGPIGTLTKKKQNMFSPSRSYGVRTAKDLTPTATCSNEPSPGPAISQLQKSISLKDHIGGERKVENESQAEQGVKNIDVFYEIQGESPRHRKLRYESFKHLQSCKRAAMKIKAIHQQEEALQRERDEKTKVACELDPHIHGWSYGKEGNLRALLTTLHHVLGPECKWKMVSQSDLVMPISVKKMYRRASFCLHPDKVQQRGGTIKQKYVAEKVFGVLREAWNKYSTEELC